MESTNNKKTLTPISVRRAMEILDVSRTTIEARVKDGTFKKFNFGRRVYLDHEQVVNCLKSKQQ